MGCFVGLTAVEAASVAIACRSEQPLRISLIAEGIRLTEGQTEQQTVQSEMSDYYYYYYYYYNWLKPNPRCLRQKRSP